MDDMGTWKGHIDRDFFLRHGNPECGLFATWNPRSHRVDHQTEGINHLCTRASRHWQIELTAVNNQHDSLQVFLSTPKTVTDCTTTLLAAPISYGEMRFYIFVPNRWKEKESQRSFPPTLI